MKYLTIAMFSLMLIACGGESTTTDQSDQQEVIDEKVEQEMTSIETETDAILEESNKIDDELNEMLNELK